MTINGIPTSATALHATTAECSKNGICDRTTGVCQCTPGWAGASCNRRT